MKEKALEIVHYKTRIFIGSNNQTNLCVLNKFPGRFPGCKMHFNPSHAAIKILINATAAGFICQNIFPTPVQVKKNYKT